MLREDLGGTYGVSVVPDFTKRPIEEYRVDDHASPAIRRARRTSSRRCST